MPQLIEIRVLGTTSVRLGSGEVVDQRAWRTAKTRDLVRLLAVAAKPVSTDRVVSLLWPDVEPARGRGSLRTAASQVRQVLGEDCLVRHGETLEITGVWVDATAFTALAATARHRLASDDSRGGLAATWEAVALYQGDLCQDESQADWASEERDRLSHLLRQLLIDAGRSACAVGWWRDAVELARHALDVDPCAERAYRVLMRAYSGLGETDQALRAFDQCRRILAEELGADPDEKTQALHLRLLRPQAPRVERLPFVARAPLISQVQASMTVLAEEGRSHAVVVTGAAGSGRTRFLDEAAASWSHRAVTVICRPGGAREAGTLTRNLSLALGGHPGTSTPGTHELRQLLGDEPVLLVLDDVHWADTFSLDVVGQLLQDPARPLLVLAAAPTELAQDPWQSVACDFVRLPPLAREEIAELLIPLLDGPPSRGLVDELAATSKGLPGALIDAARDMRSSGQLLSTPDGMVRVPRTLDRDLGVAIGPLLVAARAQVGPDGAHVLDLLAVLNYPTTLVELSRVSGVDRGDVQLALDRLCDLRLVVRRPAGYIPADPLVREAAYRWLRPSVSRDLHHRVAELADLPSALRIEHWLISGEPALACAAALQAADEATSAGDDGQLRTHLRTVRAFAREHATEVRDKVSLCERLALVCMRLGRRWEARENLEEAITLARAGAPEALPRLRRGLGHRDSTVDEAHRLHASTASVGLSQSEQRQVSCLVAAEETARDPQRAVTLLGETILAADDAGDIPSQVEARVLLARVAGSRRDFDLAEKTAKEAMVLAQGARDGELFLRSALTLVQTPAFLGDGLRQLELLGRLRDLSGSTYDTAAARGLDLTWCVVLHDLGHPDFTQAWSRTAAGSGLGQGRLGQLLDVHFSLEQDQPRRAQRLLDALPTSLGAVVADDAARILRARLLVLEHDHDGAAGLLREVLADRFAGPSLLGPEAAARLAALLAPTDPVAAGQYLEQAAALTGSRTFPRERLLMLRASAELQAATGRSKGAATLTLAAAMTAHRAGLVLHEADARSRRDSLLTPAGEQGRSSLQVITIPRQQRKPSPRPWA